MACGAMSPRGCLANQHGRWPHHQGIIHRTKTWMWINHNNVKGAGNMNSWLGWNSPNYLCIYFLSRIYLHCVKVSSTFAWAWRPQGALDDEWSDSGIEIVAANQSCVFSRCFPPLAIQNQNFHPYGAGGTAGGSFWPKTVQTTKKLCTPCRNNQSTTRTHTQTSLEK